MIRCDGDLITAGSEHPPPPLPVDDARPVRRVRPVRLARRALPGLGTSRRRGRSCGGAGGSRRARAHRLTRGRPPLPGPARRRHRVRRDRRRREDRGDPRARGAWIDGSRRIAGRTSPRPRRRGPRCDPRVHRVGDRPPPRRRARRRDGRAVQPLQRDAELMRASAELARRHGLRLHTHLAETAEEERDVLDRFGRRPVDLLDELGWIDGDVWVAHGIHFDDAEVARLGEAGTGWRTARRATRGSAPMCRVVDLEAAGVPVGLGWMGSRPTRWAACSPSCARRSTPPGSAPTVPMPSSPTRPGWPPRAARDASAATTWSARARVPGGPRRLAGRRPRRRPRPARRPGPRA